MSRIHAIVLAACVAGVPVTTVAAPQSYQLGFTLTQGTVTATAGSFTYDPAAGFTAFTVTWNDLSLDLTAAANLPTLYTTAGGYTTGSAADSFALLTGALPQPRSYTAWGAFSFSGTSTYFGFSSGSGQPGIDESLVAFSLVSPVMGTDPSTMIMSGDFSVTAVPEPATGLMLLAGLLTVSRRRQAVPSAG